MSNEWKRGTFTFDAVGLGHTSHTVMRAIEHFLLQCGWERASWSAPSGSPDVSLDRAFLRRDRFHVNFENDAVGTGGNVAAVKVGANISIFGMAGGTASTKATGGVLFSAQPADGNTITISDGVTAVTFEFDNNAAVAGGNVSVAIGVDLPTTLANLIAAVNAHAFNITATPQNRLWVYNGDGLDQHCGIRIFNNTGASRIEAYTFLENLARTANQRSSSATTCAYLTVDTTAPNNYLFIGGLNGLYIESGRDGSPNNLGHMAIVTFEPIPEFFSTDNEEVSWTTQGIVLDLFGSLKMSEDRNYRFVDNQGSNRNYTARLAPFVVRGTNTFNAQTIADDRRVIVGPRDNFFSTLSTNSDTVVWADAVRGTFGLMNTPRDNRYRLSPMMVDQIRVAGDFSVISSSSVSNNVAANACRIADPRAYRQVKRFAVADGSLLPFVNITDASTGTEFRIGQVADNGRPANIAVEWPSLANVVTISGA